ncbi:uncharacterized protein LOC122958381 [Acropora millepora]|uniref:uncharacterized protein LOC122958381 n=1 Tax=Acropora millepora TaxID=45264 RepID=UPI001CF5D6A2|nr:uncharacterized protein LOC122958381 [Acropora millepora]
MTSKKKSSWFTEKMNEVLIDSYSKHQVKKHWEDVTMQVKRKERTARHNEINRLKITGNGKLPDDQEESEVITIPITQSLASSPERKVAQILGPEVFEGISGGLDTLDTSVWLDRQPQFSTSTTSSSSMVTGAVGMASMVSNGSFKYSNFAKLLTLTNN